MALAPFRARAVQVAPQPGDPGGKRGGLCRGPGDPPSGGDRGRHRGIVRRQVRELRANGLRCLGNEHRLQIEQARALPTRAGAAVVRGDPAKLQFSVLLPAAALEDDMDRL